MRHREDLSLWVALPLRLRHYRWHVARKPYSALIARIKTFS